MEDTLIALLLVASLGMPVAAAPIVTLGPPLAQEFSTVDPGSIRVDIGILDAETTVLMACDNVCEVTCSPTDPGCIDGCFVRP